MVTTEDPVADAVDSLVTAQNVPVSRFGLAVRRLAGKQRDRGQEMCESRGGRPAWLPSLINLRFLWT